MIAERSQVAGLLANSSVSKVLNLSLIFNYSNNILGYQCGNFRYSIKPANYLGKI